MTESALERLTDIPVLDDLRIRKTAISDAGVKYLHRLRALVKLDARASNVTPGALRALQQRFPDFEIEPLT